MNAATLLDPEVITIAQESFDNITDYILAEGETHFSLVWVDWERDFLVLTVEGRDDTSVYYYSLSELATGHDCLCCCAECNAHRGYNRS